MIHYQRIDEIQEQLRDLDLTLDQPWSAEAETRLFQEQTDLREELGRLEAEQEDYRDGYDAGVEYHLGSGHDARDDVPRSQKWLDGFWAAGQDS